MAATLATSMVPSAAWADAGGADAGAASGALAASVAAKVQGASAGEIESIPGASDTGAGSGAAAAGAGATGSGASEGASGAAGEAEGGTGASGAAGEGESAASGGASSADGNAASASASAGVGAAGDTSAPATKARAASASVLAASVTSSCVAKIQDKPEDEASAYSQKYGVLAAGDVLWANLFSSSYSVIPHEDTWTYQWYAGDAKSNSADDYAPISGQTSQNLEITDELAEQLQGKYLIVKVTVGDLDFWAPVPSYGTGINQNYVPGPVAGPGQAQLGSVGLSSSKPAVGDTLTATAYTDSWGSDPVDGSVNVTFTWSQSDSQYGGYTPIEAADGATFEVTGEYQGKYLKVTASAGLNTVETTVGPVMAEGAIELYGVELASQGGSLELGCTLEAKAYQGSSWSPTYVAEGVTYTWKYTLGDPYDNEWITIKEHTGPTFTVSGEKYAGAYFSVSAYAGYNTVNLGTYDAVGPIKLKGQVDIYSVAIRNTKDDTSVFAVGDTAKAYAREQGAASGVYIDESLVTFQWQCADEKGGTYADIEKATSSELAIDASLQGKYLRCVVKANVGSSSYNATVNLPVAAAGSINVTSVKLGASGKVNVGTTLTATATAAQGDVTDSEKVTWAWYCGSTSASADTKIEEAQGNTLTLTQELVDKYGLLGKYIEARADGGFGEEDSAAVGPVVVPGMVELSSVSASGTAKVGSTLTASAQKKTGSYSSAAVADTDVVYCQWMYADTRSTDPSAYTEIPGATGKTYTVQENTSDGTSLLGKYLCVRATSENTEYSVSAGYYGGYGAVYPLGPVTLEGQYTLSSVKLESSGQGMQVGNTITPVAQIAKTSYSEQDVPADAKVTYTWYAADVQAGPFAELADGVADDGTLTLTENLKGKFLKVEAYSLDNTVTSSTYEVLGTGEYDLLRVTTSPALNSGLTDVFTGDTVEATAQAKRLDGSTTSGDALPADAVQFQWYVADAPEGDFAPIEGAASAVLEVPASAAGKYLKVVATSVSSVELVSANPVIDGTSLAGIAAKLDAQNWRAEPAFGEDGNLNDLLVEKLAEMGVSDVAVSTKSVEYNSAKPDGADMGVSTADDATNGDITYFFIDPDEVTGYASYAVWRQFEPTFVLQRDGETLEYAPSLESTMPWDESKAKALLEKKAAADLAIGFAAGDAADAVTQDLVLPYKMGGKSWTEVTWASGDTDAIVVSGGYGYQDYTGKVARSAADVQVTLAATVGMTASGGFETTLDVPFTVTVKADPAAVEEAKVALQQKVDAAFTADALAQLGSNAAVDAKALDCDVQLPTTRTLGIDGGAYRVEYSSSSAVVEVNGYAGYVYRGLPGTEAAPATLTLTVTSKENPAISASASVDVSVAPLARADIEAEAALMQQAKEGYFAAIANGQDADAVTESLRTFQKAYLNADGNLAWTYDKDATDAAPAGIVPVDLPGYDPMGSEGWRTFKSSDPSAVAHESLQVTRAENNVEVTVTSCLSSETYARYAERYADDPEYGPLFAQLANQEVSATFTVRGTADEPATMVKPTVSVIGRTAASDKVEYEYWAYEIPVSVESGTSAQDVVCKALDAAGLAYEMGKSYKGDPIIASMTSMDGSITLKDGVRSWQVFRDGKTQGIFGQFGSDPVTSNEAITVCYTSGVSLPEVERTSVNVRMSVIGPNADGKDVYWVDNAYLKVPLWYGEATGEDAMFEAFNNVFSPAGIKYDYSVGQYGFTLNTLTSPYTGEVLGWNEGTGAYWGLFVNGAVSDVGVSSVNLTDGMNITWYYAPWGAELPSDEELTRQDVAFSVIDASGSEPVAWVGERTHSVDRGTTLHAFVASMLDEAGVKYELSYDETSGYLFVSSVTSPDGETLSGDGHDPAVPCWKAFVNGAVTTDGNTVLESGDAVTLAFTASSEAPLTVTLAGSVIGRDAAGNPEDWGSDLVVTVPKGADGVTVVEALLKAAGAEYALDENAQFGMTRVLSVTSPTGSGVELAAGEPDAHGIVPGDSWYPYLNGECFEVWVSRFEEGGSFTGDEGTKFAGFEQGDEFTLYFGAYRDELPDLDNPGGGIEIDPDAPRPSWESAWPGFASGSAEGGAVVEGVLTPDSAADEAWSFSYGEPRTNVSDPLVVGDFVYVVASGQLIKINRATGVEDARADTGSSSTYFCRPVYADGVIVVPADDGSLAAFTADALACVWKTPALAKPAAGSYQSLSSLTVANGRVYAGFTVVGGGSVGTVGTLVCVNVADGSVAWTNVSESSVTNTSEGYYWAGAAVSGSCIVIGDEAGDVSLIDGASGKVLSTANVGGAVRATTVAVPGEDAFLVVTSDGVLHEVARVGDELKVAGSAKFAAFSTSTPAVHAGKAYVGGVDENGYGTLSVVDVSAMRVEASVTADLGEVKSAPLVSARQDGVYVYFTCNALPGAVYVYKAGDAVATKLFTPGEGMQEYCSASIVADAEGNLYYTNDSGTLFKLAAAAGHRVSFEANGGSHVASVLVKAGAAVERPADPTRSGYVFGGWFADAACTQAWDFAQAVVQDTTLYAKWTPLNAGGQGGQGSQGSSQGGQAPSAGGQVPPSTTPLGTVAPSQAPLSGTGAQETAGEAAAEAVATNAAGGTAAAGARTLSADAGGQGAAGAESGQVAAGLNWWALAGLCVGVVGLVCVAAWLVVARRRSQS